VGIASPQSLVQIKNFAA